MNNINARLQGVVSRGVKEAEIDENGHLIFTLTDNSTVDLGKVDGKSAYESAQDGGYTGTEAQFNSDLAEVSDKYEKPSAGIPKTDLASAVQESLEKADSALQEHQSLAAYRTAAAQDAIDSGISGRVESVESVIPAAASSTNKLVSASEMGDAIEAVEAKQLYATNAQGSFATKAALTAATTFYNADGSVATPTKNDVAYVLADESHSGKSAKYVIANDPTSTVAPVWGFVITFSDATFTQAQMDAINSGVTSAKRAGYDNHVSDSDIHVTAAQKQAWTAKQDAISDLDDIRSGAEAGETAYQKPDTGVPESDLAAAVQTKLNEKEIKLAVYGTTTAQTIYNWETAGYTVVAVKRGSSVGSNNEYFQCRNISRSTGGGYTQYTAIFESATRTCRADATVGPGATGKTTWTLTNNLVTSMSAASTDTQYPSAKAVYDAIQDALPTAVLDRFLHANSVTGALEWAKTPKEFALYDYNSIPGTNEIFEALQEGKIPVYVDHGNLPGRGIYICCGGEYEDGDFCFYFLRPAGTTVRYYKQKNVLGGQWSNSGSYDVQKALVSGTNIKTINSQSVLGSGNLSIMEMPSSTTSDNGKFLRVVNGSAAWQTVPSAENSTF